MANRVYYGEYTLAHWIKLMLTGGVALPEYQRHFVWKERDVKRLIQSLSEGQFVQPVTIALYNDGIDKRNLILDGQQRLTSILLAYLQYFPDKKKFQLQTPEYSASEDDSASDDGRVVGETIFWRYTELLKLGKTKNEIVNALSRSDFYVSINDNLITSLTDDFFSETYLGFSYVVPDSTDGVIVQKTFSQLFRNINYFGKKLDPIESRKSLYYQNKDLTTYFEGKCQDGAEVLSGLYIIEDLQPCKIDFVRYLAILSQYSVSSRDFARDVMVGYSSYSSREGFYADYVSYLLGIEQEERIDKFDAFNMSETFPDGCWKERFVTLRDTLVTMRDIMAPKGNGYFSAWYEADYWLFGLIFHILFKGKKIKEDLSRTNSEGIEVFLKDEIYEKINEVKSLDRFSKSSNRLGYIRTRLVESCVIVGKYVQ